MIKHIDRLLIVGYFKAYFVCLVSILGLYIVVDLFTNLDEFTHRVTGLLPVVMNISKYYGFQIPKIFDRLCEAIVLLAGMFTIALLQRNNELLPLLSAGVCTRRVVMPILVSALIMLSLTVLNQELLIPQIAPHLLKDKDDPDNEKEITVRGAFEPNGIHIEGVTASRKERVVRRFFCTIRGGVLRNGVHLTAKEAYYFPPGSGTYSGGWMLTDTDPPELPLENREVLEPLDHGKYFLHTQDVDFDALTRPLSWFQLASTSKLYQELQKPDSTRLASIAVLFHMRLTRPILGMILVLLGLSIILRDQNRNIFISAGMCLVLCALFFAALFSCKQLGDSDYLTPALAAWLPVLIFGPLAFVMFDAVHT